MLMGQKSFPRDVLLYSRALVKRKENTLERKATAQLSTPDARHYIGFSVSLEDLSVIITLEMRRY